MKILFVGVNPSRSARTRSAFCRSTPSGRMLMSWIHRLGLPEGSTTYSMCNLYDVPTDSNRSLTTREIRESLPALKQKIEDVAPDKIVALGRVPSRALTLLGLPHICMPHPSGLNRQLNDPLFIEQKLYELRQFLTAAPPAAPAVVVVAGQPPPL